MKREEALNILHNASVYHPDYLDALNMAIKALEQEPCEDAISRQAVIELCEGWWLGHTKEDDFATEVRALPSVNPQKPKTGHWIYICNSEVNGLKVVECSECGKRTYGSGKYCPNCGAKMVESEDENAK